MTRSEVAIPARTGAKNDAATKRGAGTAVLSPEFRLVCACCVWPRDAARLGHIRALAAGPIDWGRLEKIVHRHRVVALALNGLRAAGVTLPAPYDARLTTGGRDVTLKNLAFAAEHRRLAQAFEAAGIDVLFVKGMALAQQAYGTLAFKTSIDIDLLAPETRMHEAGEVLATLGYRRTHPGREIADDQLDEWLRWFKETSWQSVDRGIEVDLHSRLIGNPLLAPGLGLDSPRASVAIGNGITVSSFAREPCYIHLCVHGAEAGWFRLKWIADLAALISANRPDEIEALHAAAERAGAGRCSAQALLLCVSLLDVDIGAALHARLERSAANRMLVRMAMTSFTGAYETAQYRANSLGGMPVIASHFLMRAGWRHKLAELQIKVASPHDRARGVLPRGLGFLYPLLGLGRSVRGALGRRAG